MCAILMASASTDTSSADVNNEVVYSAGLYAGVIVITGVHGNGSASCQGIDDGSLQTERSK